MSALFTCNASFGEDLTELFNLLTGYTQPRRFHHLLAATQTLREGMVARIRREAEHVRAGRPALLMAKINNIVDQAMIEKLYAARQNTSG